MDKKIKGSGPTLDSDLEDEDDESYTARKPAAAAQVSMSDRNGTTGESNGFDEENAADEEDEDNDSIDQKPTAAPKRKGKAKDEQPVAAAAAAAVAPAQREKKRKSSTQATGKRTKKPKDMPRRPLSAYNIYFQREREKILAAYGKGEEQKDFNVSPGELGEEGKSKKRQGGMFQALARTIADRWKALPKDERAKFEELAEVEMQDYRKRMDKYRQDMISQTLEKQRARRGGMLGSGGNTQDGDATSGAAAASIPPPTTAPQGDMPQATEGSHGNTTSPSLQPVSAQLFPSTVADTSTLLALQAYLGNTAGQQQNPAALQPNLQQAQLSSAFPGLWLNTAMQNPAVPALDLSRFLAPQQMLQTAQPPPTGNVLQQILAPQANLGALLPPQQQPQQAASPLLPVLLGMLAQPQAQQPTTNTTTGATLAPTIPLASSASQFQAPPAQDAFQALLQQQQQQQQQQAAAMPSSTPGSSQTNVELLNLLLQQQQQPAPPPAAPVPPPPPPPSAPTPSSGIDYSLLSAALQQQQQEPPQQQPPQQPGEQNSAISSLMLMLLQQQQQDASQSSDQLANEDQDGTPDDR